MVKDVKFTEDYNALLVAEENRRIREQAEKYIENERVKLNDISEQQLIGIVSYTSSGVGDKDICEACLVTSTQLTQIRQSESYRNLLQQKQSKKIDKNLTVDQQWDVLEGLSLTHMIDQVSQRGGQLETMELVRLSQVANTAKRRLGPDGRGLYNRQGDGVAINIDNSKTYNLNIPSIVLDRIKTINQSNGKAVDYEAIEESYVGDGSKPITIKEVSEILAVDLRNPNARNPTVAETYHDLFEDKITGLYADVEG
jgi:hypothetical protein